MTLPVSPWRGFTRYLRNALNRAEGWEFATPFFPSFSVDGMHWADEIGIVVASQNVVAGAATSVMSVPVPANESWLVLMASAQIAQVAAGQATVGQVRLSMVMEGQNMPITEAVNGSTRLGAQSIWLPPYPILLHPGDSFSASFFNGHTADLNGFARILRRRLPTASTP